MHALNRAVPDKPITIRIVRNGQPLDLEATPTERRPIRANE
jgi:hypothetical protein